MMFLPFAKGGSHQNPTSLKGKTSKSPFCKGGYRGIFETGHYSEATSTHSTSFRQSEEYRYRTAKAFRLKAKVFNLVNRKINHINLKVTLE
jgi:hypothetical protein